jgi:hypothetical protein
VASEATVAAVSRATLESRLVEWGQEYGGSQYENIGYKTQNLLQRLIEHGGFVPDSGGFRPVPIRTAADEVEAAVAQMERAGWRDLARIIRLDYFCPRMAMPARLDTLRALGIRVSRAGYYLKLNEAKAYVAGAI